MNSDLDSVGPSPTPLRFDGTVEGVRAEAGVRVESGDLLVMVKE